MLVRKLPRPASTATKLERPSRLRGVWNAPPLPDYTWFDATADFEAQPGMGYVIKGGNVRINITLGAAFPEKKKFIVIGNSPGGWKIVLGAGQNADWNDGSASGTDGGFIQSGKAKDVIEGFCVTQGASFRILNMPPEVAYQP